jgi:hypothetical protein
MTITRGLAALALAVTLAPATARGADPPATASPPPAIEERLAARLDAATAAEVSRLAGEARAEGLPPDPLVATALEGASRRAPPERILAAVRRQLGALREARAALGPSSASELGAAAGALLGGVPRDTLVSLRAARPRESLVVPLVVLSDFLARRVPLPVAAEAVRSACLAGARDDALMRLRERVERDLRSGIAPASAAGARAHALVLELRGGPRPRAAKPRGPMGGNAP